jgi:hypothetical protein
VFPARSASKRFSAASAATTWTRSSNRPHYRRTSSLKSRIHAFFLPSMCLALRSYYLSARCWCRREAGFRGLLRFFIFPDSSVLSQRNRCIFIRRDRVSRELCSLEAVRRPVSIGQSCPSSYYQKHLTVSSGVMLGLNTVNWTKCMTQQSMSYRCRT